MQPCAAGGESIITDGTKWIGRQIACDRTQCLKDETVIHLGFRQGRIL